MRILCKWLIKIQIVWERLTVNWLQWIETRLACVHLNYSNPHIFFEFFFHCFQDNCCDITLLFWF
jgi:hypothetical protein